MNTWIAAAFYVVPFVLIFGVYASRRQRKQHNARKTFEEAVDAGLTTPPSLHPVIDHAKCIGCEACVHACPEFPAHTVLGVITGKANLVSPTDCIGHGACQSACPVGAISLVFGSSERGVDIPAISSEFETNVPGIYIAGELGGMGLIRNAIEQGRQALDNLMKNIDGSDGQLDVAIIGAGPAGFCATLAAHEHGLRYVTIEQDSLGGTVANFPRGKLVMTAPARLPIYGEMKFKETQKEDLISFWQLIESETGINIHYNERMENIEALDRGFTVTTSKNSYKVAAVLLTLGRRGTPRKLGVPGEDLTKVTYNMIDSRDYAGKHVCVVGGGDSALEAAHSIAEEPGTTVTLSYRSDAFGRAKRKNRDKIEQLQAAGRLTVVFNSQLTEIAENHVLIEANGKVEQLRNDAVIICVGGVLATGFLKDIGINVETKYGTA